MKGIIVWVGILCFFSTSTNAQQRIEPGKMNYVISGKPNHIFYHDTLYQGSKQFKYLFYKTRNDEIIDLYRKHQSNKVTGQVIGIIGTVATIVGLRIVTGSDRTDKGTGWLLFGTGFAASITGGYLTLMGQKNLNMAVSLFNQQTSRAALGIGVAPGKAGLVYQF